MAACPGCGAVERKALGEGCPNCGHQATTLGREAYQPSERTQRTNDFPSDKLTAHGVGEGLKGYRNLNRIASSTRLAKMKGATNASN